MVSDLLEEVASINYCDIDGKTSLRIAIDNGDVPIAAFLLHNNVDPNVWNTIICGR